MKGQKLRCSVSREDKVSVLLAVDKARKYLGYITANDALELAQSGEKSLQSILRNDMPIVEPSTVIQDILSVISDTLRHH